MVSKAQRVAIVDDEPHVLRSLRRLLRNAGFEVDTYESGDSFLRAAADREPDCLVLDLHMPQMSGFALQAQLTHSARHIPVVVITGDDTPEARSRALSLGASCYLRKPVEKKALLPAIQAAIDSAAATPLGAG
jgi:two-component system, LuxR family, response regulator FixJ